MEFKATEPAWHYPGRQVEVAETFLKTNGFSPIGMEGAEDRRKLAQNIASIIANAKTPQDALNESVERIDRHFANRKDAPSHVQFNHADLVELAGMFINKQLVASAPPSALVERDDAVPPHYNNAYRSVPVNLSPKHVDDSGKAICKQFGLHSITIDGDTIMTDKERLISLHKLQIDLNDLCERYGIEQTSLGHEKKLSLNVGSKEAFYITSNEGTFTSHLKSGPGDAEAKISYIQATGAHGILNHELWHYADHLNLKAKQHLLGDAMENVSDRTPFFSELPSSVQAKFPQDKAAMDNLYKLLDDKHADTGVRQEAIDLLNQKFVRDIVGPEGYFFVRESALEKLKSVIKEGNLLASIGGNVVHSTPNWEDGIFNDLVANSKSKNQPKDIVDGIGEVLGLKREESERRLRNTISKNHEEFVAVAPYFNAVADLVKQPNQMLIDSVQWDAKRMQAFAEAHETAEELPGRYMARKSELGARLIGRDNNLLKMAQDVVNSPLTTMAYTPEQVKVVNETVKQVMSSAGFKLTDKGPDMGLGDEMRALNLAQKMNEMKARAEQSGSWFTRYAKTPDPPEPKLPKSLQP